jgi:methylenetetrahydrofolate reductase (NADPH)
VSGDGSPRPPKLEPDDVGADARSVTSVELLRFIRREYPGVFRCGVAFNQYESHDDERHKLERKIEAGAEFIITQPQIGHDGAICSLELIRLALWIGAWMSKRIDLLYQCIGRPVDPDLSWHAEWNLSERFPGSGLYLAQLNFKRDRSRLFAPDAQSSAMMKIP